MNFMDTLVPVVLLAAHARNSDLKYTGSAPRLPNRHKLYSVRTGAVQGRRPDVQIAAADKS